MRRAVVVSALLVAVASACADVDPPVTFTYGTLTEENEAVRAWGCGPVARARDAWQGDVALSSTMPRVSRELLAEEAAVRFDFAAEPVVTGGGATLTLTATARAEAAFCGTGCEGSNGTARFSWSGLVSLPSPRGYRVVIAVDAWRENDLVPSRFAGECRIETPWRVPFVVESGRQSRDVDAPSGVATVVLDCQPADRSAFANVGCYGAPRSGAPALNGLPSAVDARLTVRFTFTPKP